MKYLFILVVLISQTISAETNYYIKSVFGLSFGFPIPSNIRIIKLGYPADNDQNLVQYSFYTNEKTPFLNNSVFTYNGRVVGVISSAYKENTKTDVISKIRGIGLKGLFNIIEKNPDLLNKINDCPYKKQRFVINGDIIGCHDTVYPTYLFHTDIGPYKNQKIIFSLEAEHVNKGNNIEANLMIIDKSIAKKFFE